MPRHKLDFRNKNHLEQLTIFEHVITSVDALPVDKREDAYLEELRTITASARTSHERIAALRSELKSEVSHRKALFDAGRQAANRAGVGALLKSNRQPAEILATGLDLHASTRAPVGVPATPDHFYGEPTDSEGEAILRWKRTVRRCIFEVQWHTDPPDADHWHFELTCTQQKCHVKGLVSGAKYWFRVRAGNAHGQSAWSQMAPVRVK